MEDRKTPAWLIEIQNKSWEPEILISGITLTFIFFVSEYLYNFCAKLIQEYGVWYTMARLVHTVSIVIINGLKYILIIHLILRGIWTGLVGLSYVFPDGVRKENLPKMESRIDHDKPEDIVIKFEKICSLLFSFIFSSIIFTLGFYALYIPIIILFYAGLDLLQIRMITIYFVIPVFVLSVVLYAVMESRFRDSNIKKKIDAGPLNVVLLIYITNIGKLKTSLIFLLYFVTVISLSYSDITRFDFDNRESAAYGQADGMVNLNNNHYEDLRDRSLRVPKASIDKFQIEEKFLKLFICMFREDDYTVEILNESPSLRKNYNIPENTTEISIPQLYTVLIDDIPVSGLSWYKIRDHETDQARIVTSVSLDTLQEGYHELKINKLYWKISNKEMEIINDWDVIPFEIKN